MIFKPPDLLPQSIALNFLVCCTFGEIFYSFTSLVLEQFDRTFITHVVMMMCYS